MNTNTLNAPADRPGRSEARRTLILGLGALLIGPVLGALSTLLRQILDPASVNPDAGLFRGGFVAVIISVIFVAWALVTGIRALRNGERSWAVWAGLLVAVLVGGFWMFMIIGEFAYPY